MCGICGLVAPTDVPDAALVGRMNEALVHRGPDEGSVDSFGRCVLGHRRLQVIDLETGSQPVANETGNVVCVFNGELYNFPELRADLAARGHEVRGTGDTPVIPHLYEEYGVDFPQRLSGMFALALWDSARQRLVLARDRVGKKPLLWTVLPDGTFAFASELKALVRLPGLRREVDPAALDAYLALQYVPGGTGLRDVHKLTRGSTLVWEQGRANERSYDVFGRVEAADEDEWLGLARETVRAAVGRRLVADVPLGALLSGGIDSSIVVALMAEASTRPVKTFTVGFSDARYDERRFARAVAERYGTEHEELVLEVDAAETLPRLAWAFDEPLGDEAALPLFLICEAARQHVTVALTGDGGDEAFGGYERYLAHRLAALPGLGGLMPTHLLRFLGRSDPRTSANRLARLGEVAKVPREKRYGGLMEVFPAPLRAELWEPDFVQATAPAWSLLGQPEAEGIAGLQRLDLETYLPGDLLLKADLASMAHSLELRSPFLDREVLELGVSLPDSLKFRRGRGKQALRRAFHDDLPPEIATREKRGFGVPLARWFRGELRELAADLLLDERTRRRGQLQPGAVKRLLDEHVKGRVDHGHRLWCLLMLELWQRSYVESEHPPLTAAEAELAVTRA